MIISSPPLLATFNLGGASIGIIIAICGMILGGVMGLAGMYFAHQRQRLWHETTRIALEKGQPMPLPPEEHSHRAGTDSNSHDLRGGLILIAVGAGTALFLGAVSGIPVAYLGAIPGLIGVALVLHWMLTRSNRAQKQDALPPTA